MKESVFVEFDGKRQAYIETEELLNSAGELTLKLGEKLSAKSSISTPKLARSDLAKSMGKIADISQIESAKNSGIALDAKVTGVNKGGLEVDLGAGMKGFCPMSPIAQRFVQNAMNF